jgi:hypothetical protein
VGGGGDLYPRFFRAWEQRIHRQSNNSIIMEEIALAVVYIILLSYASLANYPYPVSDRGESFCFS